MVTGAARDCDHHCARTGPGAGRSSSPGLAGSLGVAEQRPATHDTGRNQRPATRDPERSRPGPGGTTPGSFCGRTAAQARPARLGHYCVCLSECSASGCCALPATVVHAASGGRSAPRFRVSHHCTRLSSLSASEINGYCAYPAVAARAAPQVSKPATTLCRSAEASALNVQHHSLSHVDIFSSSSRAAAATAFLLETMYTSFSVVACASLLRTSV